VNKQDWDKVQELFEAAARRPAREREAFLAEACPDAVMRREVVSLLEAEHDGGGLESALREVAPGVPPSPGAEKMIGDYRIIRQIGSGGMGLVYEAEQQHPKRVVALKVIRGGRYVDDVQVRLFQREAQALARLRHSAIASIFESGRTPDGQHFFAMELVRGERLSDYCARLDKERAPVTALELKVRLFCRICDAVTYAHQRGVIHRDLKPANVIVQKPIASSDSTGAGLPGVKILDFGLARITESEVAASIVTSAGLIQGSLGYMSPEQARGNTDEIDLRTDIYSLGVTLYEIVSGRLPYGEERSVPESIRAISEDPPKPLTLPGGRRIPDRDLETIVRKAMEKEPARRYQSVSALAGDLERYLAQQPIIARPPSTLYQLRKLMARHRAAVGFAAVLLMVLVGFAATMTYQARRIAEARDRASLEADTSREIADFLIELFEVSDPSENRGNTVTARELLEKGAERIEGSLTDRPLVQARLMDTMGKVHRSLGLFERADELLEDAVRLRRSTPGDEAGLATSLFNKAELKHYQEELDEAEPAYREALDLQLRLYGENNLEVAHTIDLLGRLYRDRKDYARAVEHHARALRLRRQLKGDRSLEVADSLHSLGMIASARNDHQEAVARFREEYGIYQAHQQERPALTFNLASALTPGGHYDEAEDFYRKALAEARRIYGESHLFTGHCLRGLGGFLFENRGDLHGAEPLLRQSLVVYAQSVGDTNSSHAVTAHALIDLLRESGRLEEAARLARTGLATSRDRLGELHEQTADYRTALASVLLSMGNLEEAEALLARNPTPGSGAAPSLAVTQTLIQLGRLHRARDRHEEALGSFTEALRIRQQLTPDHHVWIATIRIAVGRSLADLARYADAEPHLRDGLSTRTRYFGARHPRTLESRGLLIALYRSWGKADRLQELEKTASS
jgi:serine/threonine protein kinase